jgi:hypothetical protein
VISAFSITGSAGAYGNMNDYASLAPTALRVRYDTTAIAPTLSPWVPSTTRSNQYSVDSATSMTRSMRGAMSKVHSWTRFKNSR